MKLVCGWNMIYTWYRTCRIQFEQNWIWARWISKSALLCRKLLSNLCSRIFVHVQKMLVHCWFWIRKFKGLFSLGILYNVFFHMILIVLDIFWPFFYWGMFNLEAKIGPNNWIWTVQKHSFLAIGNWRGRESLNLQPISQTADLALENYIAEKIDIFVKWIIVLLFPVSSTNKF